MLSLMRDTITVEPYTGTSSQQVATFGAAVTYNALVEPWYGDATVDRAGRQFMPTAHVILEGRVSIDARSRVTLPAAMLIAGTRTPPIRDVRPAPKNDLNLDYVELLF
jgi:hypothetical protein